MEKIYDFKRVPVVDIVNEILVDATKMGASDIHFDPKDDCMQIRIRIDGELSDYAKVPEEYVKNLTTRIKIIAGMNITESRLPQDGAIKGIIKDVELDLRVASINTNKGEKLVIRILDYTLSLNGIERLGFSDYNYKKVVEMINEPNGIILVTGATGTGKTTTVYSMLQKLNKKNANIMSIEDPIEMDIDGVNQVQVNPEIGLTFAKALRSILRQDPNIIMIGEIRDSETATIAIRASITGHLVLSTLHTNDSLSTIERLMDMDVEKYLLAEAITGIVSQKLARKLCPHCRKKRKTTEYEKNLIKKSLNLNVDEIYTSVGCDKCNNGFKGRIAIQEVLKIDQKIKDALSMNIRKDKLRNLVYDSNVVTLLQDGLIKAVRGDTTIEEILKLIELDKDVNSTFSLTEAIINSELTKEDNSHIDEALNEQSEDEITYEENTGDEFIIPEDDTVITKLEDEENNDDTNDSDDIDEDSKNMESLDDDEDILDNIDDTTKNDDKNNEDDKSNEKVIYVKNINDIIGKIEEDEKDEELEKIKKEAEELLKNEEENIELEKKKLEKNNIDYEKKELLTDLQNEVSNKVKNMMNKKRKKKTK